MEDPFCQEIIVQVILKEVNSAGQVNRILKSAGAKLFYDVYGFERADIAPEWQSECFADVHLYLDGETVDARDSVDRVDLIYPMASIGTEYIQKFCTLVDDIALRFEATAKVDGNEISGRDLLSYLDVVATQIMTDWGEEPGSKALAILIETSL